MSGWSSWASRGVWSVVLALALGSCADDPRLAVQRAPAPPGAPVVATQAVVGSRWYAAEPGAGVEFFEFPAQNNKTSAAWGPVMTDVIQHLPLSYGNTYYDSDKITYTHETSHGIHADLRNNHNDTGRRANAFYVPGNRAIVIPEPNVRKSAAAAFIPQSLRGTRYSTYITGQSDWDDTPLYLWDEWNAYINGGEAGVELVRLGLWDAGWRDGVMGQLEFTVYALAIAQAIYEQDPTYFEQNTQFREFLAFNTKRAMDVYREGSVLEDFTWDRQDEYYRLMRESADAEGWRSFCREVFGEAWANAVLFGDGTIPQDDGGSGEPQDDGDGPGEIPQGEDSIPPDPIEDEDGESDGPPSPPDPIEEDPNDGDPEGDDNEGDDNGGGGDNGDNGDNGGDNGGGLGDPQDNDPNGGQQGEPLQDADRDGVIDALDLCGATPQGRRVWREGEWAGCAGGEFRDRLPPVSGPDGDRDGIEDGRDLCSGTASGAPIWSYGEWLGCAEGQFRDQDR